MKVYGAVVVAESIGISQFSIAVKMHACTIGQCHPELLALHGADTAVGGAVLHECGEYGVSIAVDGHCAILCRNGSLTTSGLLTSLYSFDHGFAQGNRCGWHGCGAFYQAADAEDEEDHGGETHYNDCH